MDYLCFRICANPVEVMCSRTFDTTGTLNCGFSRTTQFCSNAKCSLANDALFCAFSPLGLSVYVDAIIVSHRIAVGRIAVFVGGLVMSSNKLIAMLYCTRWIALL